MGWIPDPSNPLLNRIMFMFVDLHYSINHVRKDVHTWGKFQKMLNKQFLKRFGI
ncbi:hypothetical protein SAMN05216312_103295 [Cohnella sp. OV330]|nr:hypothetical protein SAMN05216312_103295 [Cohnella sp. OV330]